MAADYYDILGVPKTASQDEIKKAFRKMAHQHHPDKKGGDEAKFKELNDAYGVLSDPEKRKRYDQFGHTANHQANGSGQGAGGFGGNGFEGFDFSNFSSGQGFNFGGSGGFEDLFSDIFSGGFGGGGRSQSQSGRDMAIELTIDFMDVVNGGEKTVTLSRLKTCLECKGNGGKPGSKEEQCPICKGSGRVNKMVRTMFGAFSQVSICDRCFGKGKTWSERCSVCHGEGRHKDREEVVINVPAGIRSGQTLSMSGYGEAGEHGARAGDLLVTVSVRPHEQWKRSGDDIVTTVSVPIAVAVLGEKIPVETVDGEVTMRVPAGTRSGEVFRIRSKGVPHLGHYGRGDHLVTVEVMIPKSLSSHEKRLFEELREVGRG